MVDSSLLAFAAILSPIFVATIAHPIARMPRYGSKIAKVLCILTSYVTLLVILALTYVVVSTGPVVDSILIMPLPTGKLALTVYVDGLSLVPTILSALFASLAQTFSVKYLNPENRYRPVLPKFNRAYSLMLLFLGGMVGACFSGNMIMIIIFWEITSICSWALVDFWHEDPKCRAAALKTFIMTHIGTLSLLIAAIIVYPVVETWEIHQWTLTFQSIPAASIVHVAMLLLFVGILPKAVQFPLHTWLPDATVAPTPVIACIHTAGFLMALYALPRFFGQIFASYIHSLVRLPPQLAVLLGDINVYSLVIVSVGAITLVIAPIFGLLESESKRVIAYCDISALGSAVMALGFGTPLGIVAGLFAMIPHVFFCGLLFFAAGAAIYRVGKTSLQDMDGLSSTMPVTAVLATIGVLSWASFPFLGYFNALWLIIHASLELSAPAFTILLFFGTTLKTAAILRMLHAIFFRKTTEHKKKITEAPAIMLFPMMILSACLIVSGVLPQLLLNYLVLPAVSQLKLGESLGLTLMLGDITTASGFWNPMWMSFTFLSYLVLIVVGTYISSRGSVARIERVYIKEEEALKPFLCGEDTSLLDGAHAHHFYHTLTYVLRIDNICHAFDIDRLYNALAKGFSTSCAKMLRLDIRQSYFAAFLSFVAGAVVVVLIAVLMG